MHFCEAPKLRRFSTFSTPANLAGRTVAQVGGAVAVPKLEKPQKTEVFCEMTPHKPA
jgi:hypothetical protein